MLATAVFTLITAVGIFIIAAKVYLNDNDK